MVFKYSNYLMQVNIYNRLFDEIKFFLVTQRKIFDWKCLIDKNEFVQQKIFCQKSRKF